MGAVIASVQYKKKYCEDLASRWVQELEMLPKIWEIEPHCAYTIFTGGFKGKFTLYLYLHPRPRPRPRPRPLLFNLYINDIFELLKNDSSLTLNGQKYFNALMFADDMIIMSTTEKGLQKSLNALSIINAKNGN